MREACHVMRTRQKSNSRDVGGGAYGGNKAVVLCYVERCKDHEVVGPDLVRYSNTDIRED
jgi:hypothetical protein